MKGTLELLCGPSGVGKSFSIPEGNKSYRWTTRSKREGEVDSGVYSGTTTDGFFVTKEQFIENEQELVGIHKYPDHEPNNYYGFPKTDIIKAINEGKTIFEQIINPYVVFDVSEYFSDNGVIVKKTLVLDTLKKIENKIYNRFNDPDSIFFEPKEFIKFNYSEIGERLKTNKFALNMCLQNIKKFDKLYINGKKLSNRSREDLVKTISKIKKGILPGEVFNNILSNYKSIYQCEEIEEKTVNILKTHFTDILEADKESNLLNYVINYLDIFQNN